MKKKKFFIIFIFFFTFLLSADEFIYKLQTPRINNKEVENIQKSLFKISLLPEKEGKALKKTVLTLMEE